MSLINCYSIVHDCDVEVQVMTDTLGCRSCHTDLVGARIYVTGSGRPAIPHFYCEECGIAYEVARELERS